MNNHSGPDCQRAIDKYGRHVIETMGWHLPWDRIGRVAIESFVAPDGVAYFVGGEVGAIKIGHSKLPLCRLAAMQMGSPIPLSIMALAKGGYRAEREYHRQFAEHRLHGEWFERCPEIEAEIARLNEVVA